MRHRVERDRVTGRYHLWDDPKHVRRLIRAFVAVCAAVLLLDLVLPRDPSFEHGELPVEVWFGFYCLYGFVACVVLVLVAKAMRRVVMRPEDHYGAVQPEIDPPTLRRVDVTDRDWEGDDGG